MGKNKIWEDDMEELLNERLGQIYKSLNENSYFKEIKKKENITEEKLEKFLKEQNRWNLYFEYEENRSEVICELLKNYYLQGYEDAISNIMYRK